MIVMFILSGCSSSDFIVKHEGTPKKGYYWRDNYAHHYGNAPPVQEYENIREK